MLSLLGGVSLCWIAFIARAFSQGQYNVRGWVMMILSLTCMLLGLLAILQSMKAVRIATRLARLISESQESDISKSSD